MPEFIQLPGPGETAAAAASGPNAAASGSPGPPSRPPPDATWLLTRAGRPVARCSLWWRSPPPYPGHRLGLVGHYAAEDPEAGIALLRHATQQLASHGCTLAIGPMDGSVWHHHRFITRRGTEPVFITEPDNADEWPGHFTAAGFTAVATYHSSLADDLTRRDPRTQRAEALLTRRGVRLRPLQLEAFDEEVRRIHAIAMVSFRRHFLFQPVSDTEFLELYRPLRPLLCADLVLIAEHQGRPVGFAFALPDACQARRGVPVDTVVINTVAVLPDHANAGLGGWLLERVQTVAGALGFRRAIHALMHDANVSGNLSRRYATPIRAYALFARSLPAGDPTESESGRGPVVVP